jgi:hypothetical protein
VFVYCYYVFGVCLRIFRTVWKIVTSQLRHGEVINKHKWSTKWTSPDLNPIENLLNLVSKLLGQDAIDKQITSENFEHISERVKSCNDEFVKKHYRPNYCIHEQACCNGQWETRRTIKVLHLLSVSTLQCFSLFIQYILAVPFGLNNCFRCLIVTNAYVLTTHFYHAY